MYLVKDGITVEAVHPSDIAFFKRAGYVEVVKPAEVAEEKSSTSQKKGAGKKQEKEEESGGEV